MNHAIRIAKGSVGENVPWVALEFSFDLKTNDFLFWGMKF